MVVTAAVQNRKAEAEAPDPESLFFGRRSKGTGPCAIIMNDLEGGFTVPETEVKEKITDTAEAADEKIKNPAPKKTRRPRTNPDGTPVERQTRKPRAHKEAADGTSRSGAEGNGTHKKRSGSSKKGARGKAAATAEVVTAQETDHAAPAMTPASAAATETPAAETTPVTMNAEPKAAEETVSQETRPQEEVKPAEDKAAESVSDHPAEEVAPAAAPESEKAEEVPPEAPEEAKETAAESEADDSEPAGPAVSDEAEPAGEAAATAAVEEDQPEVSAKEEADDSEKEAVPAASDEAEPAGEAAATAVVEEDQAEVPAKEVEQSKPEETDDTKSETASAAAEGTKMPKKEPQIPFQQTVRFANVEERDFEPKIVRELDSEPAKTSVLKGLYDPISNMLAQASTDAHSDWKYALFRILLKYGIIAFFFVYVLQGKLNTDSFSFARMPFTDAVSLWFRIVALGTITEYAGACLKMFLGSFRFSLSNLLRLVDISCESAWFLTLLYSLAALAMDGSIYFSFVIAMTAVSGSVLLHAISYEYTFQCGRRRSVLACVCTALLTALLVGLWIRLFGGDLIRIVNSFITL